MPIAINPIGSSLYEPRALRASDDGTAADRFASGGNPSNVERLQDRLELARERSAERAARREELAEERRELLREELAEQARIAAEEAASNLQDRLRQQQLERVLEAQRAEQTPLSSEPQTDELTAQDIAQRPVEAGQLTFGPQPAVTTRTAIEAISVYQETRDLTA